MSHWMETLVFSLENDADVALRGSYPLGWSQAMPLSTILFDTITKDLGVFSFWSGIVLDGMVHVRTVYINIRSVDVVGKIAY